MCAGEPTQDGNSDPEEPVSLAVLPATGLEVAREEAGVLGVAELAQLGLERPRARGALNFFRSEVPPPPTP